MQPTDLAKLPKPSTSLFPLPLSLRRIFLCVALLHVLLFGGISFLQRRVKSTPQRLVVQAVSLPKQQTNTFASQTKTASTARVSRTSVKEPEEVKEIAEVAVPLPEPVISPPKTVTIQPAKPQEKVETPTKKKEAAVPVKKPVKKQEVAKPVESAKPVEKPAVKEKEKTEPEAKKVEKAPPAPKLKKELLKDLQKELQEARALDSKEPAATSTLPTLRPLSESKLPTLPSHSAAFGASAQADYTTQLTHQLTQALRLPDVGDVKISLTLTAKGKMVALEVIKSASTSNQRYVTEQIPKLIFPAWGEGNEEKNFLLTLRPKQI